MTQVGQQPGTVMTDEQLRHYAFEILERELGPEALARFVRMYRRSYSDFTQERHMWQKGLTVASIAAEIKDRRKPTTLQK